MASSKEYLDFILDQLNDLEDIRYKKIKEDYILYYKGKIIGGVYDNRLLVKPVYSAQVILIEDYDNIPIDNDKRMLIVNEVDNREFLKILLDSMYSELPERSISRKFNV